LWWQFDFVYGFSKHLCVYFTVIKTNNMLKYYVLVEILQQGYCVWGNFKYQHLPCSNNGEPYIKWVNTVYYPGRSLGYRG
jgi:hypothetical protein